MIYTLFNLRDRKILQGEVDGEHYDSKVMARRGQDWQQKYDEIDSNPDHEIVVHVPDEE